MRVEIIESIKLIGGIKDPNKLVGINNMGTEASEWK